MTEDSLLGGLYGLLIGDALGVPYEFSAPAELPPLEQIEMPPPSGFPRAHRSAPAGAWSDDGAQALCLLASLLGQGELDLEVAAQEHRGRSERSHSAKDDAHAEPQPSRPKGTFGRT